MVRTGWLAATACAAVGLAAACADAHPIAIRFTGTITGLDDPLRIFTDTPPPAGPIEGLYTIDPAAGTVSFGDGTSGQRLPDGSASVRGTYRYGGGSSADVPPSKVVVFPHCFVGSVLGFDCLPAQGSSAYVLQLAGVSSGGLSQSFVFALVGDRLVDTGSAALLPPPIDTLDSAAFAWRFARGDEVAVATGVVTSIAAVAEPGVNLLLLAAGIAWTGRWFIRSAAGCTRRGRPRPDAG